MGAFIYSVSLIHHDPSILLIKKPGCEIPKIVFVWHGFSNGLFERFAFFWRPRKSWTSAFWRSYVRWPWIGGLPQGPRNTYRFYQKSSCPTWVVEPIYPQMLFFRSMTTLIFWCFEIWGRWVNFEPHITSLPTSNTSFAKTVVRMLCQGNSGWGIRILLSPI